MTTKIPLILILLMANFHALADEEQWFKLSGYGTLAATHSSNDLADFRTNYFQPVGPGYTRSTDLGSDSKLAVQLDAFLSPTLTFTIQTLAQRNYDDTFTPELEWANLKYKPVDSFYLRIGRVVAPTFMQAEYRNVGYAQTMVRPPNDFYFALPYYHIDGIDTAYTQELGDASLTLQLTGGQYQQKLLGFQNGVNQFKQNAYFANAILDYHQVLYRLAYSFTNNVSVNSPSIDAYDQSMATLLNAQVPGAQTVNDNLQFQDMAGENWSLGFSHESEALLLQGEIVWIKTRSNAGQDGRAEYLLIGKTFGNWTPYAAYSAVHCNENFNLPRIDASGYSAEVQQAAGVVNMMSYGLQLEREQNTLAVGVRYDFSRSADLKLQFEHIHKPAGAIGDFTQIQPGFANSEQHANVVTLAFDFVF